MVRSFRSERLSRRRSVPPLERPDPAPELVLRGREDHEIRRAPLQKLTAKLFEWAINRR